MTLAGNMVYVILMLLLQWEGVVAGNIPKRLSLIPHTNQKFLHNQDFWTMTLGDIVAVPLILNAFFHVAPESLWSWWVVIPLGLALTAVFILAGLGKGHKPDASFPSIGRASVMGMVHAPYFGFGWAMALFCLWQICWGELRGPVMWIGLTGGALYIATIVLDWLWGNFEPYRPLPLDQLQ
jgi:hypothetical protein